MRTEREDSEGQADVRAARTRLSEGGRAGILEMVMLDLLVLSVSGGGWQQPGECALPPGDP